jgi:hypothetical protein
LPSTCPIRTGIAAEYAIAAGRNEGFEAQALCLRARARRLACIAQRFFQFERTHIELNFVALETRELDEIVHHAQ